MANQVLRSGTSVAANYRGARRARSRPEFFSKLRIVVEQSDKTVFWLELLLESGLVRVGTAGDRIRSKATGRHLLGFSTNRKTKSYFVDRKSYLVNGA